MKKSMNFLEFIQIVKDENACYDLYEQWKWGDKVVLHLILPPRFINARIISINARTQTGISQVKTGTCFANSKIPFTKWFYVMWLFAQGKRGISSYQVSRDIDVSQKTAWRMLHKIRKAMTGETTTILKEKLRLMNHLQVEKMQTDIRNKKVERCQGRSFKDKVPVFGLIGRTGTWLLK